MIFQRKRNILQDTDCRKRHPKIGIHFYRQKIMTINANQP